MRYFPLDSTHIGQELRSITNTPIATKESYGVRESYGVSVKGQSKKAHRDEDFGVGPDQPVVFVESRCFPPIIIVIRDLFLH